MKSSITLKRISEMLNISISTVSRALKGHPDISETTRDRVKQLAETLDYEPNSYAISLRTNNSKEFGVIVPSISSHFYHSFISSLEEEARRYGYSLVILQSGDDPIVECESLRRCRSGRVAGVFISVTMATRNVKESMKLDSLKLPVIFFDKVPEFEACNKVCVADEQAASIAAAELLYKGKKNILAIFGNPQLSITKNRIAAFTSLMKDKSAEDFYKISYALNPYEAAAVVLQEFSSDRKPDAIFCMSDEILTGVMKSVQRLKLQFPEDVGIIAISDGYIPNLFYPEITYAETSGFKLGKLAFSRMIACLSGTPFVQNIVADAILVPGGSL